MPPSTNQNAANRSAAAEADIGAKLDELHTVAALLAGALAVAEAGSQVERCLMVASQALGSSIAGLTELA
ncbi:MAG: hypothetical protein RIR43_1954 [Pseudomonadota bacterium]